LLKAVDHVGDASGFDAVMAGCEFVIGVLELGIEQLDLIEDFSSPLSVSTDVFDLCQVLPFVEASHSVTECVVLSRRSIDEVGEPRRERFNQLRGCVVGGMHRG
jgi:hypothetical protein